MKIEIKDIEKKFGDLKLFSKLNIIIPENETTCIYGVSGCGKTTLINMIGLIENYENGVILYDGKKVNTSRKKREMLRNEIGFIFQDFGLVPNMTVEENLLIVHKIKTIKNKTIELEKTLSALGLVNILKRKVYELSGGEQQRVALAKIILKNPKLILADEPTASLDEENKKLVLDFLKKFSQNNKTVIIVSHDPSIIEFCDNKLDLSKIKKEVN